MGHAETRLRDADGLKALVDDMAARIARQHRPDVPLKLVGVRTRGYPIANRLAEALRPLLGDEVPVGALDITLYRDDFGHGERWPVLLGTEIPFDVDGAEIVLVDDVLYTGRTVRAALNAVCDLGRPARVRLAVLVDRGHRELPVEPDVVGLKLETNAGERVRVRLRPVDPVDEILRVAAGS